MRILFTAALAAGLMAGALAHAEPIPPGTGRQKVNLGGMPLDVFTYRPTSCANPALLLVFHGLSRNADRYRDYAQPIAETGCMIIVAPLFDERRFPGWAYQRGGIVKKNAVQDQNSWTVRYVAALIDWVRQEERRALDVYMIGHSAGGQFLSRVAAFLPTPARRLVIANPSTHVFPDLDTAAPFGLGGAFPRGSDVANLQRYLAAPVTIFVGQEDTGDENRNDSPEAKAQGATRVERGRNAFAAGRTMAQSRGLPFNWHLVELPGVGHSARKMFASDKAIEALLPQGTNAPAGAPPAPAPLPSFLPPPQQSNTGPGPNPSPTPRTGDDERAERRALRKQCRNGDANACARLGAMMSRRKEKR